MQKPVALYQIAYSDHILDNIEPGYLVLDNRANSRPDWREYWPIRRHLLQENVPPQYEFCGFFSPKFVTKTGLSHAQVMEQVLSVADRADVVLFSPQPDMGAFFLNVFEQAETFDAGFIEACETFFSEVGLGEMVGGGVRSLVMDSRNIVFSNYFVARPVFWKTWLALGERLFALCEGPSSALQKALTKPTSYGEGVHRKVFILERIASYLLATQAHWRVVAINPFNFAWSATRFLDFPDEAMASDALKIAYREQGYPGYLQVFGRIRQRCFATPSNATSQLKEGGGEESPGSISSLRHIVSNYRVIVDIPRLPEHYQFSGDSAANKGIVAYLFPGDPRPKTVLDIGFGTGSLGQFLNQNEELKRWVIDGIDGFVEACSNLALFSKAIYRNIWHGLAQDLDLAQLQSYDVICLFDVIEHLDPAAAKALLHTLLLALGEDSRLVISTPLWFYPQSRQKAGDLEEHLIGVPVQSMMDLHPLLYSIGRTALVGNFVYARHSAQFIDHFLPTTDRSFSAQQGLQAVLAMGLQVDDLVYRIEYSPAIGGTQPG